MLVTDKQLEELLVGPGHIKKSDFDMARQEARGRGVPLDRFLIEKGLVIPDNLGRIIADASGYPYLDFKRIAIEEIPVYFLEYIPEVVARAQEAIIFAEEDDVLKVVTTNPGNYEFFKHLEKKTGKSVKAYYALPFEIDRALRRYKGDLQREAGILIEQIKKNPSLEEQHIVRLVDLLLEYAYANSASDIHLEPLTDVAVARFRVYGVLYKVFEYPKKFHYRVSSRIKIMSQLRTDERAAPQDGRFDYSPTRGIQVDVRVSIMPVTEGEKIVIRLLMQRGKLFSTQDLGLSKKDLKKVQFNARKPWGLLMAVGPTGSGKTTTLYAMLQMINDVSVHVMTIEDPVEYNIEGVHQIQVNPAKDLTFTKGLRSIIRQDPDIIMVGEIRDKETMAMALDSAMTGHLVLTSMHANDAAATFPRLLDMGAEPFLIASAVNAVVAQRLVRLICNECRQSYFLNEEELSLVKADPSLVEVIQKAAQEKDITKIRFYRGKGCKFCKETGFLGRTAIFEVMEVSQNLRKLIIDRAPSNDIRQQAVKEGMTTMLDDGISKVLGGIATLDDVQKATKS